MYGIHDKGLWYGVDKHWYRDVNLAALWLTREEASDMQAYICGGPSEIVEVSITPEEYYSK
jgi:hypothetical protein